MAYLFNGHEKQPEGASIVYWAHLPEHSDMWSQGYIGITKQSAMKRWRDHILHSKKEKELPFVRALNKYPNIAFDVIIVGQSREYCEMMESRLRADLNIGWNINAGGDRMNPLPGGLANKQRLEKLKLFNPYWIAKEAAKKEAKERAQIRRDKAERKRKAKEEYKAKSIGQLNRKLDKRNLLGYMGVSLHPCGKYRAQYRGKSLGYYETPEKAHESYVLAKQKHLLYKE
jgi:hypothetical protein